MAIKVIDKKPNFKNLRSHALNSTKKKQGVNYQTVTLADGTKYRMSARLMRTLSKDDTKAA